MKNAVAKLILAGCALFLRTTAVGQEYHSNDLTPTGMSSGRLSGVTVTITKDTSVTANFK